MSAFELLAPRKNWTDIFTNSLDTKTLVAESATIDDVVINDLTANLLTLNNQLSVPNAPVNATSFWSSGSGNLSQTDEFGATVQYTTLPPAGSYVVGASPSVVGNLPSYNNLTGDGVSDSGIASSNVFLADGSVSMSGNLDMAGFMLSNLNNVSAIAGAINFQNNLDMNSNDINNANSLNFVSGVALNNTAASGGVCIGSNASSAGNSNVVVGNDAIGSGLGCISVGRFCSNVSNNSLAIGISAANSSVGGISIGRNNINSGLNGTSIGTSANCSAQDAICVGSSSAASASGAIAIGSGASNSTASSCLFSNIVNLRPNNNGTCDLGTSANVYKDAYLTNLRIKQGANASSGTGAVLVAGTVTVNTTAVSTGDVVLLSKTANGGVPGFVAVTISNGVSFTITSDSAADTSTFSWFIVKQS